MALRQIRNLDDIMDGGVHERFNMALNQVLENTLDPNTDAKFKRHIIMDVTVVPNAQRDAGEFLVNIKTKVAGMIPISQTVFLFRNPDGSVTAMEQTNQIPGQIDIEGNVNIPNVVKFEK